MSELKDQILFLREQGLSYNQIVSKLGCAKSTVAYYCGSNEKDNHIKRQRTKRSLLRRAIEEAKTDKNCMDCGVPYPPFILDFDHRPEEVKSFTISGNLNNLNYSMEQLKAEMLKCDIVCSNCHRFRTWSRKSKFAKED